MAKTAEKRGFLMVGNWKMNPQTKEEALKLFKAVSRTVKNSKHTNAIIAAPAPFIESLSKLVGKNGKDTAKIAVAAQDVSFAQDGAFTGSVSACQVKTAGATYSIIGHSEKRATGDTNEIVSKKVFQAVSAGLNIILCVGETERDANARYLQIIREQIISAFSLVDKKSIKSAIIAYEPVWAIGKSYDTAPKPSDIHEMSIYIKKIISELVGKKDGIKTVVLYGGSVNAENSRAIVEEAQIDGLLVGRQSLDSKAFNEMITYADSL